MFHKKIKMVSQVNSNTSIFSHKLNTLRPESKTILMKTYSDRYCTPRLIMGALFHCPLVGSPIKTGIIAPYELTPKELIAPVRFRNWNVKREQTPKFHACLDTKPTPWDFLFFLVRMLVMWTYRIPCHRKCYSQDI